MTFKDWLGQEVAVGDTIIYAAMSGRSVTMILAEVLEFSETKQRYEWDTGFKPEPTIKVRPIGSSRWKQHYGRTKYIDTRTGKGIDPYRGMTHRDHEGGYFRKDTGERIPYPDHYNVPREQREYRSGFKDYVKLVTEPTRSVTLHVLENVTKWTGARPPRGQNGHADE